MDQDVHIDELLSAYLTGDVTAEERAELERRLANDPAFRGKLEELKSLSTLLRQGQRTVTPVMLAEVKRRLQDVLLGELVSAYLTGDVTAEERLGLERRLENDPAFRGNLEELKSVFALLPQGQREVTPAMLAEIKSRLQEQLEAPRIATGVAQFISAGISGDLSQSERQALDAHLASSPNARAQASSLQAFSGFLKTGERKASSQATRKLADMLCAKLPAAALSPVLPTAHETVALRLKTSQPLSSVRIYMAQEENPWRRRLLRASAVAAAIALAAGVVLGLRGLSQHDGVGHGAGDEVASNEQTNPNTSETVNTDSNTSSPTGDRSSTTISTDPSMDPPHPPKDFGVVAQPRATVDSTGVIVSQHPVVSVTPPVPVQAPSETRDPSTSPRVENNYPPVTRPDNSQQPRTNPGTPEIIVGAPPVQPNPGAAPTPAPTPGSATNPNPNAATQTSTNPAISTTPNPAPAAQAGTTNPTTSTTPSTSTNPTTTTNPQQGGGTTLESPSVKPIVPPLSAPSELNTRPQINPSADQTTTTFPSVGAPIAPVANALVAAAFGGNVKVSLPGKSGLTDQTLQKLQQLPSNTVIATDGASRVAFVLPGDARLWVDINTKLSVKLNGLNTSIELFNGEIGYRAPQNGNGNLTVSYGGVQVVATGLADIKIDLAANAIVTGVVQNSATVIHNGHRTPVKNGDQLTLDLNADSATPVALVGNPGQWHADLLIPGDSSTGAAIVPYDKQNKKKKK